MYVSHHSTVPVCIVLPVSVYMRVLVSQISQQIYMVATNAASYFELCFVTCQIKKPVCEVKPIQLMASLSDPTNRTHLMKFYEMIITRCAV